MEHVVLWQLFSRIVIYCMIYHGSSLYKYHADICKVFKEFKGLFKCFTITLPSVRCIKAKACFLHNFLLHWSYCYLFVSDFHFLFQSKQVFFFQLWLLLKFVHMKHFKQVILQLSWYNNFEWSKCMNQIVT